MRRDYSILTIYEHALKPYIKLPSHMPKYQTHRKEETFSKQVKGQYHNIGNTAQPS